MDRFDICIIGAGVVGLAIAYEISHSQRFANRSIVIIDCLPSFGQGTSSRNSEVIHAGIYYPPDSLKAKLCVEGKPLLYRYLQDKDIPHRQVGKLIVGQADQSQALETLLANAERSGMNSLQWLGKSQLKSMEPALSACYALYSPTTGILDSHAYMASLLHDCQLKGALFAPNTNVLKVRSTGAAFAITTSIKASGSNNNERYQFTSGAVINAAGLSAHLVAQKIEELPQEFIPNVHFCKGDYFTYNKKSPFSHLIYPVPEANTAGLGIHSTLDMANQLRFGPDTEYVDVLGYDVHADKRNKFAAAIQTYFPAISADLLVPAYAGIRPKLSGPAEPAADFMVQTEATHGMAGLIQLFGIESPGLTASLALGKHVAERL